MISKNRMKATRNKGKREQVEQVGKKDKGTVELRNDLRVSLSDKLMAVATLDRSNWLNQLFSAAHQRICRPLKWRTAASSYNRKKTAGRYSLILRTASGCVRNYDKYDAASWVRLCHRHRAANQYCTKCVTSFGTRCPQLHTNFQTELQQSTMLM